MATSDRRSGQQPQHDAAYLEDLAETDHADLPRDEIGAAHARAIARTQVFDIDRRVDPQTRVLA